jgi:hypothetical protein
MRFVHSDQALPWHNPIHLDREQGFAGLNRLIGVFSSCEDNLFHQKLGVWGVGLLAKSRSLFHGFVKVDMTWLDSANFCQS